MSNKPAWQKGQSQYRHRVKDVEQANFISLTHILAVVQGCTCDEQRSIQTVGRGHIKVRHLDDCPLRYAGTQWIVQDKP